MGFFVTEDELKSELVRRICSVLTPTVSPFRPTECIHHNHNQNIKPSFIDWYFLLGVEENAETDKIRKQYRKLALHLHPDKNQHPKAELAFKLVSEAKRATFDFERKKSKYEECDKARPRSGNIHKDRFIQENIVIQNCLKAHKATSKLGEDYPVFDPANYIHRYSGDYMYPRKEKAPMFNQTRGIKYESPIFNWFR
ncbi:hypothetical protein MKX01_001038 [Papaver californicum]|nr:hypothetical protein MKX01_001038 [Papaver californicum]